jgi:acylglycerol lipase
MEIKQYYLKNHLNLNINILEGPNIENIKGIIVNIHGIGSHFQTVYDCIDDFTFKDSFFRKFNFKSFALEFHGHGKSEGKKCFINNFDDLVEDLDILIKNIESQYNQPIYLLCESMGCAVAFKYCIIKKNKIKGVIFLAPLFGINSKLKPNFIVKNILLSISYILPWLPLISSSKNLKSLATLNESYNDLKEKNEYFYKGKHRLGTCREMLFISEWIELNCSLFTTPILIFHGDNDFITSVDDTNKIYEKIKSTDKTLHIIENGYHILLIDSIDNSFIPEFVLIKTLMWLNK